jgi:uncharacterized membrane protein
MVLGRVQRTNSWEVFTNTEKVIIDSFNTLKSFELILLAVAFAVICQLVYAAFSKAVVKNVK